jgi:hypothetical protein
MKERNPMRHWLALLFLIMSSATAIAACDDGTELNPVPHDAGTAAEAGTSDGAAHVATALADAGGDGGH